MGWDLERKSVYVAFFVLVFPASTIIRHKITALYFLCIFMTNGTNYNLAKRRTIIKMGRVKLNAARVAHLMFSSVTFMF